MIPAVKCQYFHNTAFFRHKIACIAIAILKISSLLPRTDFS